MAVHFEKRGRVALITLDRPERRNSLDIDHFGMLEVELRQFSLQRLLGLGIVLFGAWWTLRH